MTTGDSNVILTLRGVIIEQDNYVKRLGVNIVTQKFYIVILLNSYTSVCQYYITIPCSHKLKFGGVCCHVIIREPVNGNVAISHKLLDGVLKEVWYST